MTSEKHVEKKEDLLYVREKPATFQMETTEIVLSGLRVANLGNATANEVKITASFAGDVVRDKKITLSSGDSSGYRILENTPKILSIVVPSLLPDEQVQFAFLLAPSNAVSPTVVVRSANSSGRPVDTLARALPEPSPLRKVVTRILPLSVGMLLSGLGLFALRKINRKLASRGSSLNNIAFVLLHQGLIDRGGRLFARAILQGRDAPHSLANYSICLATKGDYDGAARFLAAAEFYAKTKHERAVVAFNRCIVALLKGDKPQSYAELRRALSLSRDEVLSYCDYSSVFKDAAKEDSEVQTILSAKQ